MPRPRIWPYVALTGLFAVPQSASGAPDAIAIPDSALDRAIVLLARQAGVDIVSTETGLAHIRVKGLRGKLSAQQALDRLLAGSPFDVVAVDDRSFRIVRRAARSMVRPPAPLAAEPPDAAPIVVTGSKRMSPLFRFPGNVTIIRMDLADATGLAPSASLNDMASAAPVLQNTELGSGRNKIFIRGIADSSFNGPTQSTATVYLGDVQLGYSGPDPDLRLYDIQRVEIMEGPQGTLYGAGAIGGIIRITPNPVDLSHYHAAAGAGISATRGGGTGYDVNGMVNLVVAENRLGLRAVAYRAGDGGYIEDRARGLSNVNHVRTAGGRIAVVAEPGNGWSVEGGALVQDIHAADSQYADSEDGMLARRSAFAQPFHNAFVLGRLIVAKKWDSGLQFVSASGLVDYHSSDIFDATRNTPSPQPVIYRNNDANRLLTQEARLFRTLPGGTSWLVGVTFLHDRDAQSRLLGPIGNPQDIIGVTNRTRSMSAFAEGTLAVTPAFSVTAGGRLTKARTDGEPSTVARVQDFVLGRSTTRLDPTVALSWMVAPHVATYARYQSGFRTGGLAVARGVGRVADFKPDAIHVLETGVRYQPDDTSAPTLSFGISFARWRNIQADLVDRRGLPYTANIGDARILALEGTGSWTPLPGLETSFSALYTFNEVSGVLADSSQRRNRRLPETPAFAGTAQIGYGWSVGASDRLHVAASVHYVGRSVLGTGDYFDIGQGNYTVVNGAGRWTHGRYTWSLTIENIGNRKDNRFSLGNPFLLATRGQATPVRPMTLRFGVGVKI